MSAGYLSWNVTAFLSTEELACLYLIAAARHDTGSGNTIRLAWRDILKACEYGQLSMETDINSEGLSRRLREHGASAPVIRRVTKALLMYGAIAA